MSLGGHARPEYAISLAILGVLLAVGIPALKGGRLVLGGTMIALAVLFVAWVGRAIWNERA